MSSSKSNKKKKNAASKPAPPKAAAKAPAVQNEAPKTMSQDSRSNVVVNQSLNKSPRIGTKKAMEAQEEARLHKRHKITAIVLAAICIIVTIAALVTLPNDVLIRFPKDGITKYVSKYILFLVLAFFSLLFTLVFYKFPQQYKRTALMNAFLMLIVLLFAFGFNYYFLVAK